MATTPSTAPAGKRRRRVIVTYLASHGSDFEAKGLSPISRKGSAGPRTEGPCSANDPGSEAHSAIKKSVGVSVCVQSDMGEAVCRDARPLASLMPVALQLAPYIGQQLTARRQVFLPLFGQKYTPLARKRSPVSPSAGRYGKNLRSSCLPKRVAAAIPRLANEASFSPPGRLRKQTHVSCFNLVVEPPCADPDAMVLRRRLAAETPQTPHITFRRTKSRRKRRSESPASDREGGITVAGTAVRMRDRRSKSCFITPQKQTKIQSQSNNIISTGNGCSSAGRISVWVGNGRGWRADSLPQRLITLLRRSKAFPGKHSFF